MIQYSWIWEQCALVRMKTPQVCMDLVRAFIRTESFWKLIWLYTKIENNIQTPIYRPVVFSQNITLFFRMFCVALHTSYINSSKARRWLKYLPDAKVYTQRKSLLDHIYEHITHPTELQPLSYNSHKSVTEVPAESWYGRNYVIYWKGLS